jgi:hypothetical protein
MAEDESVGWRYESNRPGQVRAIIEEDTDRHSWVRIEGSGSIIASVASWSDEAQNVHDTVSLVGAT